MSCDEVRDLLALHVDGALEPGDARRVEEHLAGCAPCREEERLERAVSTALDALPGAAPPDGFSARVARAARADSRHRLVPFAAAASIAMAIFAGTLALRGAGDEEVIAHLDLLESWDLVSDPEFALALDTPEEELPPLDAGNGG